MTHPLLALQAADTTVEQLRFRREHLPERAALDAAAQALAVWERDVAAARRRSDELNEQIEAAEARGAKLGAQRTRLEAQLKTIVVVRQAEALQHELVALAAERDALDDAELAAMEEQATLDEQLSVLAGREPEVRESLAAAQSALDAATTALDAELTELATAHDALRSAVQPAQLGLYDRLREHHTVAAAVLTNGRCDGCHLDLSAGELDSVRADAASNGGLGECPNCGRLLVVG